VVAPQRGSHQKIQVLLYPLKHYPISVIFYPLSFKEGIMSTENRRLENKVIGGLIQERKSKKVTQQELALRLHTKQSTISRIENMSSSPTLRFVSKIADALGIELVISFQPRTLIEQYSEGNLKGVSNEYICINCSYRWESELNRNVIQCPQCHKRQGILYSEYLKALEALKEVRVQVKRNPPFKKAPPVRSLRNNTPKILKLMLEAAGSTFPSPRLPISLLFRIIEKSRQEQVKEQSGNTIRSTTDVNNPYRGKEEMIRDH
jgi:transcriptional regulator with XRE-family HTH domain